MKRIISSLITLLLVFSINVSATESTENVNVHVNPDAVYEYFDDGSYIVTELEYLGKQPLNSSGSKASDDYIVSGRKSVSGYDSNDNISKVKDLCGNVGGVSINRTRYFTYDINNRLIKITNSTGEVINYVYDNQKNIQLKNYIVDNSNRSTQYHYDYEVQHYYLL